MSRSLDDPRAYVYMSDVLRGQIREGAYEPGERIMSITNMASQFGHARPTCAHALHVLESEGLVVMVPGKGYYVSEPRSDSMLVIHAGIAGTGETVDITHVVANEGKLTEEHYIRVYKSGEKILDIRDLIGNYVLDREAAKELKAHLLCPLRTAPDADASYPRDG